jgi:hypothetical protein
MFAGDDGLARKNSCQEELLRFRSIAGIKADVLFPILDGARSAARQAA